MIIADQATCDEWRSAVRRALFPSIAPPVVFAFPFVDEPANRRLTAEAGRLHRACGCAASGLCMTLALVAVAVTMASGSADVASIPALTWLSFGLAIVLAGSLGKLAGLLWAQWQLVRLADSVGGLAAGERA